MYNNGGLHRGALESRSMLALTFHMIPSLNLLLVGGGPGAATSRATAAQRRAHERLMGLGRAFLSKN
eukprot:9712626-Karenia_brevis.AAC.1